MQPRLAPSKTHRFVEILALLILSFGLADSLANLPETMTFSFLSELTTVLLITLGLRSMRLRGASWLALLLTGILHIFLSPDRVEGPALCLLSAYLLFDSGWFARRTVVMAGLIILGILTAQVVALSLVAGFSWHSVTRFLVTNGLFTVLVVLFRKDLFIVPETEPRPILNLETVGLTNPEIQVLYLFWAGLSAKEIAVDLKLSDGRVRNHLTQIYRKVGVANGRALQTLIHSHRVILEESGVPAEVSKRRFRVKGERAQSR